MLTQHIALVPEAGGVNLSDLARVSAALQRQVSEHLAPIWGVSGTVDAFPYLEDIPAGYWPIFVSPRALGREGGVHQDENGQPYARVALSASWSLDASRACLEMLVNPLGDRTVTAASPRADQGPVAFLVEVCGPCGHLTYSYPINDQLVADFCTPAFFGSHAGGSRERYSFHGGVQEPFRPLPGGRLAWFDALSSSWWLRSHFDEELLDTELGAVDRKRASLRELMRGSELLLPRPAALTSAELPARDGLLRERQLLAARARADRLRLLLREPAAHPGPHVGAAELQLSAGALELIRAELHELAPPPLEPAAPDPDQGEEQVEEPEEPTLLTRVADRTSELRPSSQPPPLTKRATLPSLGELSSVAPSSVAAQSRPARSRAALAGWLLLGGALVLVLMLRTLDREPAREPASSAGQLSSGRVEPSAAANEGRAAPTAPEAPLVQPVVAADAASSGAAAAPERSAASPALASAHGKPRAARRRSEPAALDMQGPASEPASVEALIDSRR